MMASNCTSAISSFDNQAVGQFGGILPSNMPLYRWNTAWCRLFRAIGIVAIIVTMSDARLANQFLLSLPIQNGTYFEDTLTYICLHSEEGAFGIIVNRPLDLQINQVLESANLQHDLDLRDVVLEGGPVSRNQPSILHTGDFTTDGTVPLQDGLKLTLDSSPQGIYEVLEAISKGKGPEKFLFVLGYAGWAGGQLENELTENAWLTCPMEHSLLFDIPHDQRLSIAAESIGVDLGSMTPSIGEA